MHPEIKRQMFQTHLFHLCSTWGSVKPAAVAFPWLHYTLLKNWRMNNANDDEWRTAHTTWHFGPQRRKWRHTHKKWLLRFFREKFKAFECYCFYELFVLSFFSWFCHVSGFALAMAMSAYLLVCLPLWSGHSWSKKSILWLKWFSEYSFRATCSFTLLGFPIIIWGISFPAC